MDPDFYNKLLSGQKTAENNSIREATQELLIDDDMPNNVKANEYDFSQVNQEQGELKQSA